MEYKQVKFRLSSWRKLRRVFYGRKNETYSDYIERISRDIEEFIEELKKSKVPFQWMSGGCDEEICKKTWENYIERVSQELKE